MKRPPSPVAARSRLAAPLLAALGGAAWGLCHGVESRSLLSLVALAPLLLLLGWARPFLCGWLHGVVTWCVAIPWIVPTITTYGLQPGWIGGLALLLLAAYLGLFHGLFALLGAPLWRRGDPFSLVALPALWVVLEVLRGRLLTGFPWNLAAHAWIDLPGALPIASWIGAFGVSFLVLVANLGVARAFAIRRWELAAWALLVPAALLALAARLAVVPDPPAPAREVRVLQPDIPNRPFFDAAANEGDYRRLLAQSRAACRPGGLLIWPESAAWPRNWQDDARLRFDVQELALRSGCAVILNTAFTAGDRTFNSLLLVEEARAGESLPEREAVGAGAGTAGLRVERADKRHLVPFGEYVPLRRVVPFVGKIARRVGDFSPATEVRLLRWREERLGPAVCYEVVFPGETAALVRAGATLLVTVTNDGWYGDSAAPRQHLRAARFRAAENRRWLLRAAVTGISAVVRPDGGLDAALEVGESGTLEATVVGRRDVSPYSRAPWLVPLLCVLAAAVAWARVLVPVRLFRARSRR